MSDLIDIRSDAPYPSGALSNFAAHDFVFRGVPCHSMEGLLQSFKFHDLAVQKQICLMTGKEAKNKGLTTDWRQSQILWWDNKAIPRSSKAYQKLLDDAFAALFSQSADAKAALAATQGKKLAHSIGVEDSRETILTAAEFCDRLMRIRDGFQPNIVQQKFAP